jgi:GNAT superfamily N-acetyltransferase
VGKFSLDSCKIVRVGSPADLAGFSCGDDDLDDFFANEAYLYSRQLLGKTYFFVTDDDIPEVIGAFTVSNDSIKASLISKALRNRLQRRIPNTKRTRSYPAVLIGRLGVSRKRRGCDIGSQMLDYIKFWFSNEANKSGCRYVVVDVYNNPGVLHFYEKNDFEYLYRTEDEERKTFFIEDGSPLNSRMMYFDLISMIIESEL